MPPRNRRRVRHLTLALLLLGVAAWILPSYISAEGYRRRLRVGLEQALHRPVRFGSLSFHLLPRPGFTIDNAEIAEDPDFGSEPFVRVDHIDCDLRWHSLWRSRMDFAHLHLDRPSFNIVLNSRGEWNVEKLLRQSGVTSPSAPGATGKSSAPALQLDLEVTDGRINFQIGPDKKPFALTDVQARVRVNPARRQVQFEITASPVRSDLTIPTPGPVEVSGTWTPGAELRGPIDARLRTQGALLYDWIPVVIGKNPQVYGLIDSDVHLTGSLPELTVEGETTLTQLHRWGELPPSDPMPFTLRFRARLFRELDRIELERLEASFADSRLHLSGTVGQVQSAPQLDLVMSLERSRLEDVTAAVRRLWPTTGSWGLKGRIDAMLAIQGPWKSRRYGGFVGIQHVSLETRSGTFAVSDIAVRINSRGATLAPLQITLAPRVAVSAQGTIARTKAGPRYEMQLAVKGVPLHNLVAFGRGLGIRALQVIDATGSATASMHLAGSAWPLERPLFAARADLRAARFLLPGLTEPLNVPGAHLRINGDQIVADPVIAVLGTSVFTAKLQHRGAWITPWKFDLRANKLKLEEAALWFDALGLRRPLSLLERLPELASSAARREAASQIFGKLNAEGLFATAALSYRGVMLKDFEGNFQIAGRTLQMTAASFRTGGGAGAAAGTADFRVSPPLLSAKASLAGASVQSLTAYLSGPARDINGSVDATGSFQARGLAREELAENLTGRMKLHVKDISFGDFDLLAALAQQSGWGTLEPARGPLTAPAATMDVEIRDRRFILRNAGLTVSGAPLRLDGAYTWAGALTLNVRADLRRLHRRWLPREDDLPHPLGFADVHLGGSFDRLAVSPQQVVATEKTGRAPAGGSRR